MARRMKMNRKASKKSFRAGARRAHPTNYYIPMRGGIRL